MNVLRRWFERRSRRRDILAIAKAVDGENDALRRVKLLQELLEAASTQPAPILHAGLHHRLACELCDLDSGHRDDDIELALEHFSLALKYCDEHSFPEGWAEIHHNYGTAYRRRQRGNLGDNLEQVIYHQQQALRVYSFESSPAAWAATHDKLSIAFEHRIRGDHASNLEQAIEHLEEALRGYAATNDITNRATILNRLAIVYRARAKGDQAENLERSIQYCRMGLEVCGVGRDAHDNRIHLTANLANGYAARLRGVHAHNLDKAIHHYTSALKDCEAYRLDGLAMGIGANLTEAQVRRQHVDLSTPARAGGVISSHSTRRGGRDASRGAEAMSRALALAMSDSGDRAENLDAAIEQCKKALAGFSEDQTPWEWAAVQNNLGALYQLRLRGDAKENLAHATVHCERAREFYERTGDDQACRKVSNTIGSLHASAGRWGEAASAYSAAMAAGERLYKTALTRESRQQELREIHEIPVRLALALFRSEAVHGLESPRLRAAVEALEHGRTRALTEVIALDLASLDGLTVADREAFQRTRERIRDVRQDLERRVGSEESSEYLQLSRSLGEHHEALKTVIARIHAYSPDFLPSISFDEIQEIAGMRILVYLCMCAHGALALIVDSTGVSAVPLEIGQRALDAFLKFHPGMPAAGRDIVLADSADSQMSHHRSVPPTLFTRGLELVGPLVIGPLLSCLTSRYGGHGPRPLVLIASGELSLVPLHAARYLDRGRVTCLVDDPRFAVSFSPSAQALRRTRRARTAFCEMKLCAIGNPLPSARPLEMAALEVAAVSRLFGAARSHVLVNDQVRMHSLFEAMADVDIVHLACHGTFNPDDPLNSALELGDELLRLGDILHQQRWRDVRLVVLSACRTGLSEFRDTPEEVLGLPAGFIRAGAASVVASLWPVDDLSTALLMIRFYESLASTSHDAGSSTWIASALGAAQRWLRDSTNREFIAYASLLSDRWEPTQPELAAALGSAAATLATHNPDGRPFEHPSHWAAFQLIGA